MQVLDHPTGNYRFLPGIAPYSCGVVAADGFEIVHVVLQRALPLAAGFEAIDRWLAEQRRPREALCAMELRSPRPYTFQGFAAFNADYAAVLENWNVFVKGVNPVARTNVAPVVRSPVEPSLHAFCCTLPTHESLRPTFVVAGGGKLPEGLLAREAIVALGDTSAAGLAAKASFVMDLMAARLRGLGVGWDDVNQTSVYTPHLISAAVLDILLEQTGQAAEHGIHWHCSRPPIEEIEFEMDLRGIRREIRL